MLTIILEALRAEYTRPSTLFLLTVALGILLITETAFKLRPLLMPPSIKKMVVTANKDALNLHLRTRFKINYYLPSIPAIIVLLLISAALLWFSVTFGADDSDFKEANRLQNIIAILAGLGVILFAFLIFIAERAKDNRDHARILLREGLIFHLSIMYVLILLILLLPGVREFVYLIVVLMGVFVLWSVYRIFKALFDENLIDKKIKTYITDEYIRNNLTDSILIRLCKNEQLEYFDRSKYRVRYNPFMQDEGIALKTDFKKGEMLTDMRINQFEKFLEKIEDFLNENNLTLLKTPKLKDSSPLAGAIQTSATPDLDASFQIELPAVNIYCNRLIGDTLHASGEAVFTLDPQGITAEIEQGITSICKRFNSKIFKLAYKSDSKNFNRLIEGRQENAILAINNRASIPLRQALETYEAVNESFNILMTPLGSYSREEALKEQSNFFERWNFLDRVGDNYQELIQEAVECGSLKSVRLISQSAYGILREAVQSHNHLVFLQMIFFTIHLYDYGDQASTEQLKKYLHERSINNIDGIVSYQLPNLIENGSDVKGYSEYKDFIIDVLQAYLHLLRRGVDSGEPSQLEDMLGGSRSILQKIENDYEFNNIDYSNDETSQEIEKIRDELKQSSIEILFGISTWALHQAGKVQFTNAERISVTKLTLNHLPNSIEELTERYLRLKKEDGASKWGWDTWSVPHTGEVYSVDDETPLIRVYLSRIIQLGQSNFHASVIERMINNYGEDSDSVYAMQNMLTLLQSTLASDTEWVEKLFDRPRFQELQNLIPIIESLIKKCEEALDEIIANAALSNNKIATFKQEVIKKYGEQGGLQNLLKKRRIYKNKDDFDSTAEQYGIYQIDEKQIFFDSWHVGYSEWGSVYGERLFKAEGKLLAELLSRELDEAEVSSPSLGEEINALLSNPEYHPAEIVFTNLSKYQLQKLDWGELRFEPDTLTNNIGRIGQLVNPSKKLSKGITVIPTRLTPGESYISFLNLSKSLTVTRSAPDETTVSEENIAIEVVDLGADDTLRQNIINSSPQWLQNKSDPESFLRRKVQISVYVRLKVETRNSLKIGKTIKLRDSN